MNPLLEAAWEVHQFLTRHKVPYVIIGGLAVQHWAEPRVTVDVDLTAMYAEGVEAFVRLITTKFSSRTPNLLNFARRTRVVTIRASNGEPVDISLGVPGYEDEIMHRAVAYELARGKSIRICSAEDLIIHKCVAGRGKDLTDIERVIQKRGGKLEVAYIRHWLNIFSDALDEPDVLERFERAWRAEKRASKTDRKRQTRPRQDKR